jgi:hypothetical protein
LNRRGTVEPGSVLCVDLGIKGEGDSQCRFATEFIQPRWVSRSTHGFSAVTQIAANSILWADHSLEVGEFANELGARNTVTQNLYKFGPEIKSCK